MTWLGWYMGGVGLTFVLSLLGLRRMIENATFTVTGEATAKFKFQLLAALFLQLLGKSAIWPLALPYELYLVTEGWETKVAVDCPVLKEPPDYKRDMHHFSGMLSGAMQAIATALQKELGHPLDAIVGCDALLHAAHHAFAHAARTQLGERADRIEMFADRARLIAESREQQLAKKTTAPAEQAPSEEARP